MVRLRSVMITASSASCQICILITSDDNPEIRVGGVSGTGECRRHENKLETSSLIGRQARRQKGKEAGRPVQYRRYICTLRRNTWNAAQLKCCTVSELDSLFLLLCSPRD